MKMLPILSTPELHSPRIETSTLLKKQDYRQNITTKVCRKKEILLKPYGKYDSLGSQKKNVDNSPFLAFTVLSEGLSEVTSVSNLPSANLRPSIRGSISLPSEELLAWQSGLFLKPCSSSIPLN